MATIGKDRSVARKLRAAEGPGGLLHLPKSSIFPVTRTASSIPKSRRPEKLGKLLELVEADLAYRTDFEANWIMNGLFLEGHQWIQYDKRTQTITSPKPPTWRVMDVVNLTRSFALARIGQAIRSSGDPVVIPASADAEDEMQAKGDSQWFRYIRRVNDWKYKRAWLMTHKVIKGTVARQASWNPHAGPVEPMPLEDSDGNLQYISKCQTCRGTGREYESMASQSAMPFGDMAGDIQAMLGGGGSPLTCE